MIEHLAPKGSEKGIHTYLVAEDDVDVYEWLKLERELADGRRLYLSYELTEKENEEFTIYDDEYNLVGTESFKERMIRLKGDMNDEDMQFEDLHYGKTLVDWRRLKESITSEEISLLRSLKICVEEV